MVNHHHHPLGIEDPFGPKALELPDGDRGGDVIGHDQVNPDIYELARADLLFATMGSEDLFR